MPMTEGLRARWPQIALAALLLGGFLLRLIDLHDAPLDFHPTRQYRDALIARSIYYGWSPSDDPERQALALSMRDRVAELEPPILESSVAAGYLVSGGESFAVARVLNALIWALGGWALYALIARVASPLAGLLGVAYYLALPFGVIASRSFQPDALMVALIAFAAYAAYRWSETRAWNWALLTAAAAGLAVLVKALALYFVAGMLVALVLAVVGARAMLRDRQVWAMAALTLLLPSAYYLFNIADSSGSYVQDWVISLLSLAADPGFYVRWLNFIGKQLGLGAILLALGGVALAQPVLRWMLAGLWIGYAVYGITLPHQTTTHEYYHLLLVWLLPLSLAPVFQLVLEKLAEQSRGWRLLFAAVVLGGAGFGAWIARSTLVGQDYRADEAYWTQVAEAIPADGDTIALTQYYGHLLMYYGWRHVALWPETAERQLAEVRGDANPDFVDEFEDRTEGIDYFLVTAFLEQQPELESYLYGHYSLYAEGPGYLIFDLSQFQP